MNPVHLTSQERLILLRWPARPFWGNVYFVSAFSFIVVGCEPSLRMILAMKIAGLKEDKRLKEACIFQGVLYKVESRFEELNKRSKPKIQLSLL